MAAEPFHGNWKIVGYINVTSSRNTTPVRIEGAIFTLQENGEIRWELGPEVDETFPLFQCDCYEVVYPFVGASIQMGAVSGHMFEFMVECPVPRDTMLLTFQGWCVLQCQHVMPLRPPVDFPFSFLQALTEGYFADLELMNGSVEESQPDSCLDSSSQYLFGEKGYKIHSVIMELSKGSPAELTTLPREVAEVILYYLYSQSLPSDLTTEVAGRCIELAPPFLPVQFPDMCREFIHRTNLKEKIIKLVNEVHTSAEAMSAAFHNHLVTIPSRFCSVIKLAIQHASVAFIKLVELCVLYGEEAPTLKRNERLEILRYAKSRLPILLTQFVVMLRTIKSDFSSVKPSERNDIAAHIVPEIEALLQLLANLMKEARDSCNEIYSTSVATGCHPCYGFGFWEDETGPVSHNLHNPAQSEPGDETLTESLFAIFKEREVLKFFILQKQIANFYLYMAQRKENFEDMNVAVKVRCVARNLEQLLEELPVFLLRLEEVMIAFDDRFQWKDFKFCLQLAISQVCQTVHHLRKEKNRLHQFFLSLSDLVQRPEFDQSLINLKLLDAANPTESESTESQHAADTTAANSGKSPSAAAERPEKPITATSYQSSFESYKKFKNSFAENTVLDVEDLNLGDNICTPKNSKENMLALNAANLFKSSQFSDMVFEIVQDDERVEIPCHRVIVAARCDWFRRALLSGMKESILKRIVIEDASAQVFELFLEFIYTGQITEFEAKSLDTLADLIALADKYEVESLKVTCEQGLILNQLDENSVIYLLSMADQYNARTLRSSCMEFIARNPEIMARELFEELSPELQMEVYDITMWSKPKKIFTNQEEILSFPRYMLMAESSSSSSVSSRASSPPNAN